MLRGWLSLGLLLCLWAPGAGRGQSSYPIWLQTVPGAVNSEVEADSVAVAPDGSIYVGGGFGSSTSVGHLEFGSTHLVTFGSRDGFLAKYDGAGRFQWVRQIGGAERDFVREVAVDPQGHCYVTGTFTGLCRFEEQTVRGRTPGSDVYLAKYSPEGRLEWLETGGSEIDDYPGGLKIDPAGNLLVLVTAGSEFRTTGHSEVLGGNLMVLKYSSVGQLLWASSTASPAGQESATTLAVDSSGNSYVSGFFTGVVDFKANLLTQRAGSYELFLAKYDPEGKALWARYVGQGESGTFARLVADGATNLFMTAPFYGGEQIHYRIGPERFYSPSVEVIYVFLAGLDSEGTVTWAQSMGGANTLSLRIWGILRQGPSDLYVVGEFSGRPTISGIPIGALGNPIQRGFIAKYTRSGTFMGVQVIDRYAEAKGYSMSLRSAAWTGPDSMVVWGAFSGVLGWGNQSVSATGSSLNLFLGRLGLDPKLAYSVTPSELILSWPADAAGYLLEASPQIAPEASWTRSSTGPTRVGGRSFQTNSIDAPHHFYRLRQP